jgi:hypothetical protein
MNPTTPPSPTETLSPLPATPGAGEPGRLGWFEAQQRDTVAAIVECLLPAFPVIDGPARQAVLTDVVRFTHGQVQALPEFLRLPYKLAVMGFEWLPMVRWGRRFVRLDAARQTDYVERWSEAKLGAMRGFVKLIRGCALLAYYDHPTLRAVLDAQTAAGALTAGSAR